MNKIILRSILNKSILESIDLTPRGKQYVQPPAESYKRLIPVKVSISYTENLIIESTVSAHVLEEYKVNKKSELSVGLQMTVLDKILEGIGYGEIQR